ncbi:hypothetical protein EP30_01190 [Bifidobacterium sp. UTCIF-39]|uniref:hypothetical protein n=1 Tax=Bifidobacterium sp. UTCIF-39 TaxID=1465359 RepID=UPI001129B6A8|nr:hypothetical protein [Bifidobacterium sp. UTCIF-39]TPF97586.1 hypothetical protein EP30_01190 [Bifidobacterium sp. UTCIF-39]
MTATADNRNSKTQPMRIAMIMRNPFNDEEEWTLGEATIYPPSRSGENPVVEVTGSADAPKWVAAAGAIATNGFARMFDNMWAGESGITFEDVHIQLGRQGDRS